MSQRSLMSTIVGFPVRALRMLPRTVLALLVAALLLLNFATLVSVGTFTALSGLVETVVGVKSVRSKAEAKHTDLTARAAAAEDEVGQLKDRATERDLRIASLEQELADTEVVYRGDRKAAKDAVSEASQRISQRAANAAVRNVASMPGEALPFFGIAVVAGATASEIADTCALMTEMHELDVAFNPDHATPEQQVCGGTVPTGAELWAKIKDSPAAVWQGATAMYTDLPDLPLPDIYDYVLSWGPSLMDWTSEGTGGQ